MPERDDGGFPVAISKTRNRISEPAWFAGFLGLLITCSFPSVLFGWGSFYTRDFSNFGYPLASYVQQSYRAGEIPLWNPYNFAGIPFLAQWNTMALYPLSILYVIFPLPWSLNFFVLLHLWGAGLAMYFFSRQLFQNTDAAFVAGTAYTFSGLLLSTLMWPNNIAALAWLPLVLWLVPPVVLTPGKSVWPAAMVVALQVLTGAPELILMTCGLLVLVILAQRRGASPPPWSVAIRLVRVLFGAAALSAAQWIPFLELLRYSQRGPAYDSGTWALSWSGFGNFVVPFFHTFQSRDGIFFQPNQQWITSYYPGATVLFLAGICLQKDRSASVRILGIVGVISCWVSLGPAGGLYSLLRRLLPAFGAMRFPIKCIVPALIALSLLAGLGARAVRAGRPTRPMGLAAVTVVFLWSVAMTAAWLCPSPGEQIPHTWASGFVALTFLMALILFCALFVGTRKRSVLFPMAMAVLVYGDVFSALQSINPIAPAQAMRVRAVTLDPEPRLGSSRALVSGKGIELLDNTIFPDPSSAILLPRESLALNANLPAGIPKLDGFFSLYTPGLGALALQLMREGNANSQSLLNFLSVSHVSRPGAPWRWDRREGYAGYLSIVPNVRPVAEDQIVRTLFSPDFDPGKFACVTPEMFDGIRLGGAGTGEILSQKFGRNRVEATVKVQNAPVLLVIAQQNYPGWQAQINGRSEAVLRVNGFFQGVRLNPGINKVDLRFLPRTFFLGAVVSISSLALCLRLWIARFARKIGSNGQAELQKEVFSERNRLDGGV